MTVTSVGLSDGSTTPIYTISGSPVTTSGTLTFTFETQAANTVLAGPSLGVAAQPSFRALTTSDIPAFGVFSPTFQSGYLQYIGSTGTITGNTNFLVGLKLPSPLGGTVPGLLIGSGVPNAVIITDTVTGSATPGINLAIAAGETASPSTAAGGTLTLLGGAAASGVGGTAKLQGGTSASGNGGDAIVQAGNASTAGNSGNIYLLGGTATGTNKNGGSITLAMSAATGTGAPGFLNIKSGSTTLYTITNTGAIFIGGTTPGTAGQVLTAAGGNLSPTWSSLSAVTTAIATTSVVITFSATAMTVNCALSNVFKTTFTANVTTAPTVSTPSDGQTIRWFITQDATGGRTMTWPTSFKWPGGTKGVLSTAPNAVDMLEATFVAATSSWYATLTKAFS
jgi:hypothetical protein